jgi:hypothetical protein
MRVKSASYPSVASSSSHKPSSQPRLSQCTEKVGVASPTPLSDRPNQVGGGRGSRVKEAPPGLPPDQDANSGCFWATLNLREELPARVREHNGIPGTDPTLKLISHAALLIDVGHAGMAIDEVEAAIRSTKPPHIGMFKTKADEKELQNYESRIHSLKLQLSRAQFAAGHTGQAMATAGALLAEINLERLGLPHLRGLARDKCDIHVSLLMAEMSLASDATAARSYFEHACKVATIGGHRSLWQMEDLAGQGRRRRIGAIGAAVQLEAEIPKLDPTWKPRDDIETAVFHALMGDSQRAFERVCGLEDAGFFIGSDPAFAKFFGEGHPDHAMWNGYRTRWTRQGLTDALTGIEAASVV